MISIENQVYTGLSTALTTYDENIQTSGVFTNTPSSYPFVSIEEIDNAPYTLGMDSCKIENFVSVAYEIIVFVKNQNLKKSNANSIANVVDTYMQGLGFIRDMKYARQNDDETDYRIYLRYSAVVSSKEEIYRR